jgi:hypothetical protein
MRSAARTSKLALLALSLAALVVTGVAAATVAGTPPAAVADTSADGTLAGTVQTVTRTQTADGLVTTVTEPEKLGTFLGDITPTWSWHVDGTGDAAAYDIVATGLRTVYTAATAWNGSSYDMELAKYVDGSQRWARLYNGPAGGYDRGEAVAARGSRIYVVGRRDPSGDDAGDMLLVRWDGSGNLLWKRTYDSGSHLLDEAVDVAVDGDGNVTVVGYSLTAATDYDWVVISYRPDGTRRWVQRYDGPAHGYDRPARMLLDSAGRVYVVGSSTSAANGWDAMVIKYSATGARLWARRFNGSADGRDAALALRARPGGGVYVVGYTTSATTGQDALVAAYTSAGTRLWAVAEVGEADSDSQCFDDLEVRPDGDLVCGGYDFFTSTMDRFCAYYDPEGDVFKWSWSMTDAWSEQITAIAKDAQGGIYLTGTMGTATGTQIMTVRECLGGAKWECSWPAAPTGDFWADAIAVYGVNAYIAGYESYSGFDEVVLGHVY